MKNGYLVATILDTAADQEQEQIKPLLGDRYQSHAEALLKERIKRFAKIVGVTPKSVSVKNYKSRWDSCSNRGEISFNSRIILAPHHIINYVVVHELCHLLEHNHSSRYWKLVEQHVPDWKDCRDCLKNKDLVI
jgi:predicted metal-dependent hydrolase